MRRALPALALAALTLAPVGCGPVHPSSPDQGQVTMRVVRAAMAAGAPAMALHAAEILLQQQPDDQEAMVAKAAALAAMGQVEDARAVYRQVLEINPGNADAQIGLGDTLVRTNPAAAEAAFRAALGKQPNNLQALNELGIVQDLQGRHENAQRSYRQVLVLAPDRADVRANLELSLKLSNSAAKSALAQTTDSTAKTTTAPTQDAEITAAPAPSASNTPITATPAAAQNSESTATPAPAVSATSAPTPSPAQNSENQTPSAQSADATPRPTPVRHKANPMHTAVAASHIRDTGQRTHVQAAVIEKPPTHANQSRLAIRTAPAVAVRRNDLPNLMAEITDPDHQPAAPTPQSPTAAQDATNVGTQAPEAPLPPRTAPSNPAPQPAPSSSAPAIAAADGQRPSPQPRQPHPGSNAARVEPEPQQPAPPISPSVAAVDTQLALPQPIQPDQADETAEAGTDAKLQSSPGISPSVAAAESEFPLPMTTQMPSAHKIAAAEENSRVKPAQAGRPPVHGVESHPHAPNVTRLPVKVARQEPDAKAEAPAHSSSAARGYYVQLSATVSAQAAEAEWTKMRKRWPALLSNRSPAVQSTALHDRKFWRLRTGGFANASDANNFCADLRAAGSPCWTVAAAKD